MLRVFMLLAIPHLNVSFHYWTPSQIRSFRQISLPGKTRELAAVPDNRDSRSNIRSNGFYVKAGTRKPIAETSSLNNLNPQETDTRPPNLMKISLIEDLRSEKVRIAELNSLLDTFYDIIDDKEQSISIEDDLLTQMHDIRGKVSDSLLGELDTSSDEKSLQIHREREIVQNISALASSLALEIYDTGEMIRKSEESIILLPDFMNSTKVTVEDKKTHLLESQMQKSVRSFRYTRDERVLLLLSQFEEFNDRNKSHFLRDSIMYSMENDAYPLAIAQSAPIRLQESELIDKKNSEIALESVRAVGMVVMSLVALTSSFITASGESIGSEEARTSADTTSAALAGLGNNLKDAISALQIGLTATSNGSEADNLKLHTQSAEMKEVAGLLGATIVEVARGSTNTVGIVSYKIGSSLRNSSKWQNATSDLAYSLTLMLFILKVSVTRVVSAIKAVEIEPTRFEEL